MTGSVPIAFVRLVRVSTSSTLSSPRLILHLTCDRPLFLALHQSRFLDRLNDLCCIYVQINMDKPYLTSQTPGVHVEPTRHVPHHFGPNLHQVFTADASHRRVRCPLLVG